MTVLEDIARGLADYLRDNIPDIRAITHFVQHAEINDTITAIEITSLNPDLPRRRVYLYFYPEYIQLCYAYLTAELPNLGDTVREYDYNNPQLLEVLKLAVMRHLMGALAEPKLP